MNYRPPIIFDLLDQAIMVENRSSDLLKPVQPGLYLPTTTEPVIRFDQTYFDRNGRMIMGEEVASMRDDIFDHRGNLIISARRAQLLRLEPYLPVRGMGILKNLVEFKVTWNQAWLRHQFEQQHRLYTPNFTVSELAAIVDPYLVESYQGNWDVYEYFEQLLCSVDDLLGEYLHGDEWVIHSVSYNNTHLTIKKEIDYRVDFYNRMHQSDHVVIAVGGAGKASANIADVAARIVREQFPERYVETHLCRR